MCFLPMRVVLLFAIAVVINTGLVDATDIHVDEEHGISNASCCNGGPASPCESLTLALECVVSISLTTPVSLIVSEGEYTLTNDSRLTVIEDRIGGFTITGNCYTSAPCVNITCDNGAGLSFIKSNDIKLENLVFTSCGFPNNSTSKDFSYDYPQFQEVSSTLYFLLCRTVTISHVTVQETEGTGVVMYSTVGDNTITNSNFIANKPLTLNDSDTVSGGGGVYIEFAYCYPGNTSCFNGPPNIPDEYTRDSTYTISNCLFKNNIAYTTNKSNFTFILPQKSKHLAFGRGGGLSLFFKGIATKNSLTIDKSNFTHNRAIWGGGIFIEMQDWSSNNSVYVSNSLISGNECFNYSTSSTGGGGARAGYVFFDDTHVKFNAIEFENCTFSCNNASFGGGISFYAAREPSESIPTNSLVFINTNWGKNRGIAGSAADLSVWHDVPYGAVAVVNFTDCFFQGNMADESVIQNRLVGVGTLYLDSIPVYFMGDNYFMSNVHSAIAALSAGIHITPNSNITFYNNSGRNGGAIALFSGAFIETSPYSNLSFVENNGTIEGGAIYYTSIGEHKMISPGKCFIRYSDITLSPEQWESNFFFSGNIAGNPYTYNNAIFASSLLSCLWEGDMDDVAANLLKVFCWSEKWDYDGGNCTSEVRTLPARFRSKTDFVFKDVFPGKRFFMDLSMIDDRQTDVRTTSVFLARSRSHEVIVDNSSTYISSNHITLHTESVKSGEKVNGQILLETIDPRVVKVFLNVTLLPCPPGMTLKGDSLQASCECGGTFNGVIKCNLGAFNTQIQQGYWIGYHSHHDGSVTEVVGRTPYYDWRSIEVYTKLPQSIKDVDRVLCGKIKRNGTLCGKCIDGYGTAVHTQDCIRCDADYMWALYLLSQYVPSTLLFIVVVVLDIRVTSASANAFIFFSQVLPTVFTIDGGGAIALPYILYQLVPVYSTVYNIWNLQFFTFGICLSPNIGTLDVISITYLEAAYPLLLIGIVSIFVWLYEKGYSFIVCIGRPLHTLLARFQQHWKIERSLIHAFASFILLSYSRFIVISFLLLNMTNLFDMDGKIMHQVAYYDGTVRYFSAEHAPFAAFSLLILLIFAFITPLLLIVPSFARNITIVRKRWPKLGRFIPNVNRCPINHWPRLTTFLEAFNGCYRDGTNTTNGESTEFDYRWFAGFYLILRVSVFGVYAFSSQWFMQYTLLQLFCLVALASFIFLRPYKDDFYNNIDAGMFALLLGINSLTIFNYGITVTGLKTSIPAFTLQIILVLVPLVYISIVLLKRAYRHMCARCVIRSKGLCCTVSTDREQLLASSTSETRGYNYLMFVQEAGRENHVNNYRPDPALHTQESEKDSPPPTERDSGLFTRSSRPSEVPVSTFASGRIQEGPGSHEIGSFSFNEKVTDRYSDENTLRLTKSEGGPGKPKWSKDT